MVSFTVFASARNSVEFFWASHFLSKYFKQYFVISHESTISRVWASYLPATLEIPLLVLITNIYNVGGTLEEESLLKISNMIYQCCGECATFLLSDLPKELSHVDLDDVDTSDIIFPVLGRSSLDELYDHYYIPMFNFPRSYYFTLEPTGKVPNLLS